MFSFRTAGESHGPCLTVIVEGVPRGVRLAEEEIAADLARRQIGYGRGGRMAIERDRAELTGGVRWGVATGAPVALLIRNRDWANWEKGMSPHGGDANAIPPLTRVRPGHADLPGALKYGHVDARNILERSSARETAGRVAAGAVAKAFLKLFDIGIGSYVDSIGSVSAICEGTHRSLHESAEASDLRMPDQNAAAKARKLIDEAKAAGDTLGGTFICFAENLPVGLGSHVSGPERLDGRIAGAMISIPAIKGVEFGLGFRAAALPGSQVHDAMLPGTGGTRNGGVKRPTNNAGGLEGGITNGETLWLRAAMKPIPTLMNPLPTIDLKDGQPVKASTERSDVCAVAAASVVGEAMLAAELARAFLQKFGADNVDDIKRNFDGYLASLEARWKGR